MDLIDPFETVEKADMPPQSSTRLAALVPSGKHVGHGLDLKVVRGPKKAASGTALEHYRGKKTATSGGPFGKSVKRGLEMTGNFKPSWPPMAGKTSSRVKSGKVTGRGSRKRDLSMQQLRGTVARPGSQSASSRGQRIDGGPIEYASRRNRGFTGL